MKPINLSKWKIAANLGLACLFTISVAQAANISWGATGTFTDNTVFALAGAVSNEVYGLDFGGSGAQTTANGYAFTDYATSGNTSIAGGGFGLFGGYLTGGATSGDAALDSLLTHGLYGGTANTGTLNNLTVGQAYAVLVLLDDTRGGSAGPSPTFTVTDGVTTSPSQQFEFANGSPSVGGYITGTFTASATSQALTVLNGGSSQYNVILLVKAPNPVVPLPVLLTNIQPASAAAGIGGQAAFIAAFSESPPVNLQWQYVSGGTTNPVTAGNATVVTVTNDGIMSSTLMFTDLQPANSGSYLLEAVNATNNLGVAYSSAASLAVNPLIYWRQTGTFTDNTVLALAGSAANEVYGVDFGAGAQTTANGYTFGDVYNGPISGGPGAVNGNMSMAGNISQYNGYFNYGETGDGALDTVILNGVYGGPDMVGMLNNLTVGKTYNVLVLLDDTRVGPSPPAQTPGSAFYGTDGVSVSPYQPFVYPNATNAIGGDAIGAYILGTFTAQSTNEPLSIVSQDLAGQFINSQYNAILVVETTTPPPASAIYLAANSQPTPTSVDEGSNIVLTAAFVNYYAPINLQWQVIINGVTNNINAGVINSTNLGIVSSSLTLSNVQLAESGNSYQLEAINATNGSDVAYSSPILLTVIPVITWGTTGTFTSDSVLALAGAVANEIYGVAFFGSATSITTANGYTFSDFTSGNMSIAGTLGFFGGYLTGGATTGDSAFDGLLTEGGYGGTANTGTLNNLTVGQKYTVLALLDDTRGGAAGGTNFVVTDGVTTSSSQPYAFANGWPAVGGYIMGTFTATATTRSFSVENIGSGGPSGQYNAVLLEKFTAAPPMAPTLGQARVSGGNLILTGTDGTPGAGYTVLTTTNLSPPVIWTTNSTGTLDGTGAFSNAIPISATPRASFFRLRLP